MSINTRQLLIPPGFAWVRAFMRLLAGGIIYILGYPNIAQVFAVMAFISLIATVEIKIAKKISGHIKVPKRNRPRNLG